MYLLFISIVPPPCFCIGRWGDGRSPAFGELSDSHFVSFALGSKADRRAMWGEVLLSPEDVYDTFVKFVEGKVSRPPPFHNSNSNLADGSSSV